MPALLNPLMMTLGVTHCIQDSVTNFTNRKGLFFARQPRCLFFSAALKVSGSRNTQVQRLDHISQVAADRHKVHS